MQYTEVFMHEIHFAEQTLINYCLKVY